MATLHIELNDRNAARVGELSRATGKTANELVNEAVERLSSAAEQEETTRFQAWQQALFGIEGMWKDRDDLPDFAELRKSWDRIG